MQVNLQLDIFEGPLDLLLYLIKKNDLDISKISISKITDQYLAYLEALQELDVDNASEYLYMAAELAFIKSRALLPHQNEEEEAEEDPAGDLISRLKEFERFKMAAQGLKERTWLYRDVFARGSFKQDSEIVETQPRRTVSGEYEIDSFELVKAFAELLAKLPKKEKNYQIIGEHVSVTDRIYEVLEFFKDKESVLFTDLFGQNASKMDRVATFLALLEMVKLRIVRVYQTGVYEPIRVQRRIEVSEDILKNETIHDDLESYR